MSIDFVVMAAPRSLYGVRQLMRAHMKVASADLKASDASNEKTIFDLVHGTMIERAICRSFLSFLALQ